MSFENRPVDITKVKCDAIVNSLGIGKNVKVYGAICKSIVKAAKSQELIDKINSFEPKAIPAAYFISSGYYLPSKYIINIVSPYFVKDKQLFQLEFVYKRIFNLALINNLKHIAVPIMGTGANGYPHAFVLKMLTSLVEAFSKKNPNIKITICTPVINVKDFYSGFDEEKLDKSIKEYFESNESYDMRSFEYDDDLFDTSIDYPNIFDELDYSKMSGSELEYITTYRRYVLSKINQEKVFLPEDEVLLESGIRPVKFDMSSLGLLSVTTYIDKYIDTRFSDESGRKKVRDHVWSYVGGEDNKTSMKSKHNKEERRTTISVPMLMRYILALHMTVEEANDLLSFCGKAFSPVSKEDHLYQTLIKLKKYDISEINGLCLKENVNLIFQYGEVLPQ